MDADFEEVIDTDIEEPAELVGTTSSTAARDVAPMPGDELAPEIDDELAPSPLGEGGLDDEGGGHEEADRRGGSNLPAATSRALVRHDPLSAYMQEIRRFSLLSREEEHRLAVAYFKHRDVDAARRLVESNLRLVVKIAHEYQRSYRNLLDLIQEGNVGLVRAIEKYDPYRGVKLSSYAAWWIRAYMLKFILNNWRLVKIGTTQGQRKLFFNLQKEKRRLEQEGFDPDSKALAKRLDVSEDEVREMDMRLSSSEMSLDAPARVNEDGEGPTHLDLVRGTDRPDVTAENREFSAMLRDLLTKFGATLEGRERTLFEERIMSDEPATLVEIGKKYDITRERARQLEARLKTKLEAYLREHLGDTLEIALTDGPR